MSSEIAAEFSIACRVYIEDTDAGGVVYYANYLKFMERARTEFFRSLGFPKAALLNDSLAIIVCSVHIDYLTSAQFDDELMVTVTITKVGHSYAVIQQNVYRQNIDNRTLLAKGEVKVACTDRIKKRPVAFPDTIRNAIKAFVEN